MTETRQDLITIETRDHHTIATHRAVCACGYKSPFAHPMTADGYGADHIANDTRDHTWRMSLIAGR